MGEALSLFQRTLTDRERVLGPNHPDTVMTRNNVAWAYHGLGLLPEALRLYEQALTDAERVLGPDHPYTLTIRNNLANASRGAGPTNVIFPPKSRPRVGKRPRPRRRRRV
jgi:hypothetical protein